MHQSPVQNCVHIVQPHSLSAAADPCMIPALRCPGGSATRSDWAQPEMPSENVPGNKQMHYSVWGMRCTSCQEVPLVRTKLFLWNLGFRLYEAKSPCKCRQLPEKKGSFVLSRSKAFGLAILGPGSICSLKANTFHHQRARVKKTGLIYILTVPEAMNNTFKY